MEYLMTYGWAILIIAVVLGALFQLGVFNSSSFSPRAPPGACQVFRPSGPGTVANINLMGVCTGQLPQYVAQFNGASSYVSTSLSLNPASPLTLSGWIYAGTTSSSAGRFIAVGKVTGSYGSFLSIGNTGVPTFVVTTTNGIIEIVSGVDVRKGWHMVVGTYDGVQMKIYIDSALKYSYPQIGNAVYGVSGTEFGRSAGESWYFNGSISNIQIYNASLSANQVQALYLKGLGGAPSPLQNLVGWWPLNGNSNDYSGNNNNGVPTAVTFTSQYGK